MLFETLTQRQLRHQIFYRNGLSDHFTTLLKQTLKAHTVVESVLTELDATKRKPDYSATVRGLILINQNTTH